MITFNCNRCGKEKTERACWYKKRINHYCSRDCANKAQINPNKLTRKDYEKEYWNIPENKIRRKESQKDAYIARMVDLGESYIKNMLSRAKSRAKDRGLEFCLTTKDIVIPTNCPILNLKLEYCQKQGGRDNSPALDRIDSSKGYIKGNIQVISSKANRIKTNATVDEIEAVVKYLKELAHCQYTSGLTLTDFQKGKTL